MYINSELLPELNSASCPGASSPRAIGFQGISLLAAAVGTRPCAAPLTSAVALAVPRVKGEVSFVALPKQPDGVASLLGTTNIHNYMTRAYAAGEGASGPPPREEPV